MLELYHNNISVCSQRARLVLAEKGVPWTSHHVNLIKGEQLSLEFKALNPRGLVPVLRHGPSGRGWRIGFAASRQGLLSRRRSPILRRMISTISVSVA